MVEYSHSFLRERALKSLAAIYRGGDQAPLKYMEDSVELYRIAGALIEYTRGAETFHNESIVGTNPFFHMFLNHYCSFIGCNPKDTSYVDLYRHFLHSVLQSIEEETYKYKVRLTAYTKVTDWISVFSEKGRDDGAKLALKKYIRDNQLYSPNTTEYRLVDDAYKQYTFKVSVACKEGTHKCDCTDKCSCQYVINVHENR